MTRRTRIRRAGVALGLLLAWAAAGCIFQPREAENPQGPTGPAWTTPLFLGNELGNMKRALESRPPVLTNYRRAFREGAIVMELDPADQSDLGTTEFQDWTQAKEEARMSGILGQAGATLAVVWTPRDSLDNGATQRFYRKLGYRLTFTKNGLSVVYSGDVDLYFEDDGTGSWYITEWHDQRDNSGNHTWGWLRARNRVEFGG